MGLKIPASAKNYPCWWIFLPFLDPLHTIKTFSAIFPTRFNTRLPTAFPTGISHKIFPQDFPARFSHKIFLSWILIGWLPITLFQMLHFHQSLPFLNWLFPLLPVPQHFPARISHKIFLSWILIGWLPITLFQMLHFHQSLLC